MPSFAFPAWLLLLLLVPPLVWRWRRRGRAALRFSDTRTMADLPTGRVAWASRGGWLLRGLGLAFLVVALAGPRWPDHGTRLPTEGISIAMVVDVSASMNERDFLWDNQALSRLEGVKKVFRLFVAGGEGPEGIKLTPRSGDLIGLVTFATRPETACPLTLDHATLLKILEEEQARTIATEATTNPGDAIAFALHSLQSAPTRRKVLIFLTDGESNVPPPALTPRQAAQLAGNLSIPIYAIGAGNEFTDQPKPDTPQPLSPKGRGENGALSSGDAAQARKSLEEVAKISKGRFFLASDGPALIQACAEIDRLEREKIQSFEFRRYHEEFVWFALLSLAAWLTLHCLESTWWRRLP